MTSPGGETSTTATVVLWERDEELALISRLIRGAGAQMTGVIIVGEPGIGKSSLWWHGVADAARTPARVLATTCVQTESEMPYAGLEDLVADLLDEYGPALPALQRDALDGAFRRVEAPAGIDPRTVAAGVASVLRLALDDNPVVMAVDDLHWMDRESQTCLAYAVRRLLGRRLRVLFALRERSPLWQPATDPDRSVLNAMSTLPAEHVVTVRPTPLSGRAIGALLRDRLGVAVSADEGRQLAVETRGNPFWALELGQTEHDARLEDSVPDTVGGLIAERIAHLDPAVVEAACLVAALGRARPAAVLPALDPGDEGHGRAERLLDAAVEIGLLAEHGGRIVPSHPLIGTALLARLPVFRRRRLYRHAATLAETGEARALQLLAAYDEDGPATGRDDDRRELLDALDEAGLAARRRGAPGAAARFAARALALAPGTDGTDPGTAPGTSARAVTIAELYGEAGEPDLLLAQLRQLDLAMLGQDLLERAAPALAQTTNDRTGVAAAQAVVDTVDQLPVDGLSVDERVRREALVWTLRADLQCGARGDRRTAAVRAVEQTGRAPVRESIRRRALGALAYAQLDVGEPVDEVLEQLHRLGPPGPTEPRSGFDVENVLGMARWYALDLPGAREAFSLTFERHLLTGDERMIAHTGDMLAYIEILAGLPDAAAATLLRVENHLGRQAVDLPSIVNARGLLHLVRGEHEAVDELLERQASGGDRSSRTVGFSARLQGLLALQRGDPARAVLELERFIGIARDYGIVDPHRRLDTDVPLAHALVLLGDLAGAEQVIEDFGVTGHRPAPAVTRGQQQWVRALVAAHRSDLDAALEMARDAVALLADGPLPAEHGRSLLVLAEVHGRRGEPDAATRHRRHAHTLFERIGHTWWAECTARSWRPALTASEQAVVDLVAGGASNRDVASALHLSVRTVESHLARVFRKLGVRSRHELAP